MLTLYRKERALSAIHSAELYIFGCYGAASQMES